MSASSAQRVEIAGLLESFKKNLEILEGIYKELEDYLETKRMAFPRFYFLSNAELLGALAQTKTVESVQQHVAKSFEGIAGLSMTDDGKNIDIDGIKSYQGEEISLRKPLRVCRCTSSMYSPQCLWLDSPGFKPHVYVRVASIAMPASACCIS